MPEAGGKNSTAWPADGLPIGTALSRLRPALLAAYDRGERSAPKDLAERRKQRALVHKGAWNGALSQLPDVKRRLDPYDQTEKALLVELRSLVEREPYELRARDSPLGEPRLISPVAIGAFTAIDVHGGEADCGGERLLDLRLHQKALPDIEAAAREAVEPAAPAGKEEPPRLEPKVWFDQARKRLPQRLRERPADYASRLHEAMKTAPVRRVWSFGTLKRRLYDKPK